MDMTADTPMPPVRVVGNGPIVVFRAVAW